MTGEPEAGVVHASQQTLNFARLSIARSGMTMLTLWLLMYRTSGRTCACMSEWRGHIPHLQGWQLRHNNVLVHAFNCTREVLQR